MPTTAALLVCLLMRAFLPQGELAAADAQAPADWPTFKGDSARTGRGPALDLPISLTWSAKLKGSLYSSPVCAGSLVVLGSSSKRIYGLDLASGAVRWQTQLEGRVWGSTAALDSGKAYIGAVDGCVHVLSLADGSPAGSVCPEGPDGNPDGADVLSPMLVDGGRLVFGSDDDTIFGYVLGRAEHWSQGTGDILHDNGAAESGGLVVIAAHDAKVYALGLADGRLRWIFKAPKGFNTVPAMDALHAYIGDADGNMHALALKDGSQDWSFRAGGAIVSSPALSDDGGLIFGSTDHSVYCLDAKSGAKRWTYKTGDYVLASPLVTGSLVWIGSYDGTLYVLDGATGQPRWRKQFSGGIYTSAAVSGDRVLVAGRGGELDCFQAVPAH